MASYRIVYDVEVRRHLAAIDRNYHSLTGLTRCSAAVGLKPSATGTKAAFAA